MKSKLYAVFGHYDSRGGTTAIELPEQPNAANLLDTFDQYDRVFGVEEEILMFNKAPLKWDFNPGDDAHRPSRQDFMFVAQLFYPDDFEPAGDLEEQGAVLIDEGRENELDSQFVPRTTRGGRPTGGEYDPVRMVKLGSDTLKQPVQLEFIPLTDGKHSDESFFTDQYDGHGEEDDIEAAWKKAVIAKAQVLKGDQIDVRDWNDDAFGFMIGTGE